MLVIINRFYHFYETLIIMLHFVFFDYNTERYTVQADNAAETLLKKDTDYMK